MSATEQTVCLVSGSLNHQTTGKFHMNGPPRCLDESFIASQRQKLVVDRIKLLSAMNRGDDEDRGLQPTSLVGPTTLPMAAGDTEWQL